LCLRKVFAMFARRWFALAVGCACLAGLIGCSGGDGSLATVSGVVTQGGAPVEGAKITFHSTVEVEGKQGMSYGATTDSSGKYVISAVGKDAGMPPGLYKVTVVKYEGKGVNAPQEGIDAGQLDAMVSDSGGTAKGGPVNLLPKKYARPNETDLSATLEPGKNRDVNFDLKGK
jgi:hypothetical protein